MPLWLNRLLLRRGALFEAPESALHEWAEFNLPTRDNLEALLRAEEDRQAPSASRAD
jgi:hypothetical protein